MSMVKIRSAFRVSLCLLLLAPLAPLCVFRSAHAQVKTNLSSSVTSESMTAVWVARERGLFKKHGLDMQFILMPRNPLAVAALIAGEIRKYDLNSPNGSGGFAEVLPRTVLTDSPGTGTAEMAVSPDGGTLFLAGNQRLIVRPAP